MSFIDSWDSGQPNAFWDAGLQWDVNVGPPPGDVTRWTNRITSEHNTKPKFMAMVAGVLQAYADMLVLLQGMSAVFDVDTAIASQEDTVGEWVGVSRNIAVPLQGVFFSWATPGLGWGQGNWIANIHDTELVALPDNQFRILIYAKIAANHWDGSIPGAYAAWDIIFSGTGFGILIQDLQNMHMVMALTGPKPSAVIEALFTGGYLSLRPDGVQIDRYYTPAADNVPYFGWGVENANISGWGVGYWGQSS